MSLTRKEFLRGAVASLCIAGAGGVLRAVAGEKGKKAELPAGKRWGMAIDLQLCRRENGCRLCSQECHREHNVPAITEPAHEVKWIWQEPEEKVFPFQKSRYASGERDGRVPVLCNHCEKPACVRVCPTGATWRRQDGIVMMDYHRCIGCRYCMAACPYGSRSFNFKDPRPFIKQVKANFPTRSAGVVEKCNFCEERLAKGQIPVCVEVCPQKALIFGDLHDENSAIRQILKTRLTVQRQPELGCGPSTFYLI